MRDFMRLACVSMDMGIKKVSDSTGARIRALRKAHKMTLAVLAKKIGVTHGFLSLLERGESGFRNETIEAIAEVFNVSPSLLQNPDVEIERLADISEILSDLAQLPPGRRESVIASIRHMINAARS